MDPTRDTDMYTERRDCAETNNNEKSKGERYYKHRNEATGDINMLGLTAIHNPRGIQRYRDRTVPSSLDQHLLGILNLAQAKLPSEL